jgi:transcriptional regulator with XRE-family HTH domain
MVVARQCRRRDKLVRMKKRGRQRREPLSAPQIERGLRMAATRMATGLSAAQFADRLGVPRSGWSVVESGEREISKHMMRRIYQEFGISPTWTLCDDPRELRHDVRELIQEHERRLRKALRSDPAG